jgi:hypothetical protein
MKKQDFTIQRFGMLYINTGDMENAEALAQDLKRRRWADKTYKIIRRQRLKIQKELEPEWFLPF